MITYFKRIGIALSVLLNVTLGGKSNQTFSARNWDLKRRGQPNLVSAIDLIFVYVAYAVTFWLTLIKRKPIVYRLDDHCMESWIYWRSRKDVIYEIEEGDTKWLKVKAESPKDLFHKD